MIPSSAWFSETNTNHAKTIIVLGEVKNVSKIIAEESYLSPETQIRKIKSGSQS